MLSALVSFGIVSAIHAAYWVYYTRNKEETTDTRYRTQDYTFECDDDKDKPVKPQLTKEEKEAKAAARKDAVSRGSMAKRAINRIEDYIEEGDTSAAFNLISILRGADEEGHKDIKVFAEFKDESVAFYHADQEPNKDTFIVFSKDDVKELKDIFDRAYRR